MGFFIGCGIVLTQGDNYILVQETRGSAKKDLFSLPSGTLEIDEDIVQCIIREVQEETGLTIKPTGFLGVYQLIMVEDHNNVLFNVFTGVAPVDAVFYSEEHKVIQAFTYDEIVAMESAGKLRAPTIVQAIDAYRAGKVYDLSVVHPAHIATLPSVTVQKSSER